MEDYYALLEVGEDASEAQIREAIKRSRRVWVKRQNAPSVQRRHEAERVVALLDEAETTLLDRAARARYDERLRQHRREDTRAAAAQALAGRPGGGAAAEWAERAMASCQAGRYSVALHEIGQAIALDYDNGVYYAIQGDAQQQVGQVQAAIESYRLAVELEPATQSYRSAMAALLINERRFEEALRVLEAGWSEDADDGYRNNVATACYNLAYDTADRLHNGSAVIVDPAQADRVRDLALRGLAARPANTTVASKLAELLGLADQAARRTWTNPPWTVWRPVLVGLLVVFGLALFSPAVSRLGLLFLAGAAAVIGVAGRRWRWQITEQRTRGLRVRRETPPPRDGQQPRDGQGARDRREAR